MARIYIELRSGLGNQLFQFAFGYSLAMRLKRELVLCPAYFDSRFKYWLKKALGREARAFRLPLVLSAIPEFTIDYKAAQSVDRNKSIVIIDETKISPGDIHELGRSPSDIYLKGYWQHPELFGDAAEEIKALISPAFKVSKVFNSTIENFSSDTVGIHIRRGDFLTNKAFGACSSSYYIQALDLIKKSVRNPKLLIFTNDKDWVNKNLQIDLPYTIYSNPDSPVTDVEEMLLMSKMNSLIISNSTFSWWSAFLNSNPGKLIICPKTWFLSSRLQLSTNLIMPGWTIIHNELEVKAV